MAGASLAAACAAAVLLLLAPAPCWARVWDLEHDAGAVAGDASDAVAWKNGRALNKTLASLVPGDVLVIPAKTFYVMGGITASGLRSVTLRVDGVLALSTNLKAWPTSDGKRVMDFLTLNDPENVTMTSAGGGSFDGRGRSWWGPPGIGYLERVENRPKLLKVNRARNCLFEKLLLKDSPYWTMEVSGDTVEIRYMTIDARRLRDDGHSLIDLTAFNTDGIDVMGRNFWVHDCSIWNQDDCIAIKDGSENMLFERLNASGLGLTIGSIGGSVNRNITVRDCYMHRTFKGIYMKFRDGHSPGLIADVLYENIVMDEPEQVPIWIGPAQQSDSRQFWAGHPCSILWPEVPGATCRVPASGLYRNITLRNITINNPKQSPGLIYGNVTNPMQNVVFDNVRVTNPGSKPWGKNYYKCEGVQGIAMGDTWPVPPCFKDQTRRSALLV